ncbi:hypothetical protein GGR95_002256 [Sulfitobacter undariae]|uniref:Uncharacterized protein n=1 Tax=Sulfitobacter undariae TaxID=1563671 RepID=A0A7W6H1C7_9RHOB|nr:hypothetical protein [Sulfitobacter undariae]
MESLSEYFNHLEFCCQGLFRACRVKMLHSAVISRQRLYDHKLGNLFCSWFFVLEGII